LIIEQRIHQSFLPIHAYEEDWTCLPTQLGVGSIGRKTWCYELAPWDTKSYTLDLMSLQVSSFLFLHFIFIFFFLYISGVTIFMIDLIVSSWLNSAWPDLT
jgi:hypothetical protein